MGNLPPPDDAPTLAPVPALVFLTSGEVLAIYRELRRRAGQPAPPVRDRALLESALQRPCDAVTYGGEVDPLTLATRYMLAIAGNHPYIDGNKRVAYIAGLTFLVVNRYLAAETLPDDADIGHWLEEAVAGTLPVTVFVERLHGRLALLLRP